MKTLAKFLVASNRILHYS